MSGFDIYTSSGHSSGRLDAAGLDFRDSSDGTVPITAPGVANLSFSGDLVVPRLLTGSGIDVVKCLQVGEDVLTAPPPVPDAPTLLNQSPTALPTPRPAKDSRGFYTDLGNYVPSNQRFILTFDVAVQVADANGIEFKYGNARTSIATTATPNIDGTQLTVYVADVTKGLPDDQELALVIASDAIARADDATVFFAGIADEDYVVHPKFIVQWNPDPTNSSNNNFQLRTMGVDFIDSSVYATFNQTPTASSVFRVPFTYGLPTPGSATFRGTAVINGNSSPLAPWGNIHFNGPVLQQRAINLGRPVNYALGHAPVFATLVKDGHSDGVKSYGVFYQKTKVYLTRVASAVDAIDHVISAGTGGTAYPTQTGLLVGDTNQDGYSDPAEGGTGWRIVFANSNTNTAMRESYWLNGTQSYVNGQILLHKTYEATADPSDPSTYDTLDTRTALLFFEPVFD